MDNSGDGKERRKGGRIARSRCVDGADDHLSTTITKRRSLPTDNTNTYPGYRVLTLLVLGLGAVVVTVCDSSRLPRTNP